LIDLDILRYRIGFACETTYYDVYIKGEEEHGRFASFIGKTAFNDWLKEGIIDEVDIIIDKRIVPEPVDHCLHSVKLQIESMVKAVKADSYMGYLSGTGNFRENLVDYYKANRKDARKPYHYDNITDYLISNWDAVVVNGEEADDALGIAQVTSSTDTVICSIDKDLDCIPGNHYNFVNDEHYFIDEVDANRNFFAQMISGDTADNIPGLYKITGKRHSSKLSDVLLSKDNYEDMWWYVFDLYVESFLEVEDHVSHYLLKEVRKAVWLKLREIGKLLWIKRLPDDDWEPPELMEGA
jgi:hypothetical protein